MAMWLLKTKKDDVFAACMRSCRDLQSHCYVHLHTFLQVITPAGEAVAQTISTSTAQAAAATSAAANTAADTLPQLAQQFVEGTLKPVAAAAAEQLPAAVEEVGGKLVEQEGKHMLCVGFTRCLLHHPAGVICSILCIAKT